MVDNVHRAEEAKHLLDANEVAKVIPTLARQQIESQAASATTSSSAPSLAMTIGPAFAQLFKNP